MKIKSLSGNQKILRNKKVLLRLDLNVPLSQGKISNDYKLLSALPTIKKLLSLNCSIIIVTHLGEPSFGQKPTGIWSTKPLATWFEKKLAKKIILSKYNWGQIKKQANNLEPREIMLLENIRCFKGEITNDKKFAKNLASLAQVYINDAFAVSHRAHASVSAVKKYLPSFAGLLLTKEINNLIKVREPKSPFVLIVGGAKITTKISLLKKLAPRATAVLLGGAVANTFLSAHKKNVGQSLVDKASLNLARRIYSKKMILPVDFVVLNNKNHFIRSLNQIEKNDLILDIGPKTIKLFLTYLKSAKTICWNGPVGMFEKKGFEKGSKQLAKIISELTKKQTTSIIGGGETVSAVGKRDFTWVSTGGGAALAFLGGENLPGLQGIVTL